MTPSLSTTPDLSRARDLVLSGLQRYAADVFLFGSFAHGKATFGSDIDIGILPHEPIPPEVFSGLRAQLEEAPLLFAVELIDLSKADSEFRERVIREGVRWDEQASA